MEKKKEIRIENECLKNKELAIKEFGIGNKIFFTENNDISDKISYLIFKKYNLILNKNLFYPESENKCFKKKMNYLISKKYDIEIIKNEIDSLLCIDEQKKQLYFNKDISSFEFFDEEFLDGFKVLTQNIKRPFFLDVHKFKNDKPNTFKGRIPRFWITIDSIGNIKNIENYLKSKNMKIRENKIKNTKCQPAKFKKNDKAVEIRMLF